MDYNKPSESTLQPYSGPHFYLTQFMTLFVLTLQQQGSCACVY